jgi:hypothetical protein
MEGCEVEDSIGTCGVDRSERFLPVPQVTFNQLRSWRDGTLVPTLEVVEHDYIVSPFEKHGDGDTTDVSGSTRDERPHMSSVGTIARGDGGSPQA